MPQAQAHWVLRRPLLLRGARTVRRAAIVRRAAKAVRRAAAAVRWRIPRSSWTSATITSMPEDTSRYRLVSVDVWRVCVNKCGFVRGDVVVHEYARGHFQVVWAM